MAYKIMEKDKISKESDNVETATDKGVNSTDWLCEGLFAGYAVRTDLINKKIIIDFSGVEFPIQVKGRVGMYVIRLTGLIHSIDVALRCAYQRLENKDLEKYIPPKIKSQS